LYGSAGFSIVWYANGSLPRRGVELLAKSLWHMFLSRRRRLLGLPRSTMSVIKARVESEACALCRADAPLRDSHIVPAFVARWIKETSATGYLRSYMVPNRRAQDFETKKLLCHDCEQRFSAAEDQFARDLFRPYHEGRSRF
jgi:hypothetical protein